MATQVPQQGWSQQTAAVRQLITSAFRGVASSRGGTSRGKRKKSSRTGVAKKASKRKASSIGSGQRSKKPWMVKGSLAAKRYMAKIRRKRK